jgi:outer membrane biosynthesis protein TonB
MFESMGQRRSRRPQRGAMMLALVINGSGFAALVASSGKQLVEHISLPMTALVELLPAPPAATAGPAAAAAAAARPAARPEPVTPDAPPEEEPPPTDDEQAPQLDAVLDQLTKLAASTPGGGIGPPGVGSGGTGCLPGEDCADEGEAGGCPPGMICDGEVIHVTSADVQVKRRVAPRYPEAARSLGLGEVRCVVRFSIDVRGQPAAVTVDDCPAVFHPALEEAALRWRFYPVKDASGRAQPATFRLAAIFRLR